MKNYARANKTENITINKSWQTNPDNIILFDNGSYEIKHSTANKSRAIKKFHNAKFFERANYENPFFIENISTDFPTDNISSIGKNFARPQMRGLLNDIDLQLEIWEEILNKNYSNHKERSYQEHMMIFSHPPLAPDETLDSYLQIVFDYFSFGSCIKSLPHVFTAIYAKSKNDNLNKEVQLVIDSGFSSTTIVPIFGNKPILNSIKRLDISGKLLTNYLKESLANSIELDIRKEFYLANLIKEEHCYLSKNFPIDMKISSFKNSENNINKRIFTLPEYRKRSEDALKRIPMEKHSILINSLRFIVPEIIFNPTLVGIDQGGIQEGIIQAMAACHSDYRGLLCENIILSGGNVKFMNFKERLRNELVPSLEVNQNIQVYDMNLSQGDSVEPVIEGMKIMANDLEWIKDMAITKQDYNELGFNAIWKNCL